MFDIKKKHHYVWAWYLKNWSINDRDVFYLSSKGVVACDSVYGLAAERDFYKVNTLTEKDLFLIRLFSSAASKEMRLMHEDLLSVFTRMSLLISQLEKTNKQSIKLQEMKAAYESNVLENMYSKMESDTISIYKELLNGNIEVLDVKHNKYIFFNFFGNQMTRTKAFRDIVINDALRKPDIQEVKNKPFEMEEFIQLVDKNWWFVSFMFGMNIGTNIMMSNSFSFHLIKNKTEIPFITSDQPIINIHEDFVEGQTEPPSVVDFFYPLSPSTAVMVNMTDRFKGQMVEINEPHFVEYVNLRMARRANKHFFAKTAEHIRSIKEALKKNKKALSI